MPLDWIALVMKGLTFAGVLVAATGMVAPIGARAQARFFALGALGVALMVANAWIAGTAAGLLIDGAFAALAVVVLVRALRQESARVALATGVPTP